MTEISRGYFPKIFGQGVFQKAYLFQLPACKVGYPTASDSLLEKYSFLIICGLFSALQIMFHCLHVISME